MILRLADHTTSEEPTTQGNRYSDIAPALGDYTDNVLFGDVWERPGLSKRDRSLITVAILIAPYRTNELPRHLQRALGGLAGGEYGGDDIPARVCGKRRGWSRHELKGAST